MGRSQTGILPRALADVLSTAAHQKAAPHCKSPGSSPALLLYFRPPEQERKSVLFTCILYILEQACSQIVRGVLSSGGLAPLHREPSVLSVFRHRRLCRALFSQILPQKLLEEN